MRKRDNKELPDMPYAIAFELALGFLFQAMKERLEIEKSKPDSKVTADTLVDIFATRLKQYLQSGDSHVDSVTKH